MVQYVLKELKYQSPKYGEQKPLSHRLRIFLHSLAWLCRPKANMADHSVVARDELHESEVSQSLMFCFENDSPENLLYRRSVLFYFAVPTSCCVSEYIDREEIEIFHLSPLKENSGSMQFVETEKRRSRSPRELKFVCYVSGQNISEKSFKWRVYVVSGGAPILFSWSIPSPS